MTILRALGLETVIEPSARDQLMQMRETLGSDVAYLRKIWKMRYPKRQRKATGAFPFVRVADIAEPALNITPIRARGRGK